MAAQRDKTCRLHLERTYAYSAPVDYHRLQGIINVPAVTLVGRSE